MNSEAMLQEQVANYLALQYPDAMFHSDFGSGAKLTPGQAAKQKRQNGGRVGWPDMFIAEPVWSHYCMGKHFREIKEDPQFNEDYPQGHGLFLELKKEGTRLKKKNGDWATEHIAEQAKVIEGLRQRAYCAEFAVGFEEAKRIIDEYLGEK